MRQISEIARAAVRAGAATADGEKRAFRLAARDPRWVPNPARPSRCRRVLRDRVPPAHAGLREPLPGLSSRSGSTCRRMTRCPPGPCRCWAAAPVWSGPRAAEPRFVTCHRSPSKQENRRGDSRGEFGLCDPRRSHATTGASVRLASVAHAHPLLAATASAARVRAATVFRPAEAGRGRPVPARRAHGSGEPIRPCRQISEIARAAVRAGAANAGGEKRAFRLAARDPRWVPNPARPSRCRRVLLDRVPPAHAALREPLPGLSSRSGSALRG